MFREKGEKEKLYHTLLKINLAYFLGHQSHDFKDTEGASYNSYIDMTIDTIAGLFNRVVSEVCSSPG